MFPGGSPKLKLIDRSGVFNHILQPAGFDEPHCANLPFYGRSYLEEYPLPVEEIQESPAHDHISRLPHDHIPPFWKFRGKSAE